MDRAIAFKNRSHYVEDWEDCQKRWLFVDHPNAIKFGYVLYHRIVMENHLNRLLNPNEVVHHKDGDKKNNNISNLEIMNRSKHSRMHGLQHGRKFCILKCPECGVIFIKPKNATHLQKSSIFTSCSRKCSGKFSRKIQLFGLTHNVESAISENIVSEYVDHTTTPR